MIRSLSHKTLLIGFGNPAREDDGIGPAVAKEIEKLEIKGLSVDSDYQLTVEDASFVAEHDSVVFVDASVEGEEPFAFSRLSPKRSDSFSSHSVNPETVMGIAYDLFNAKTEGYLLGIRGYSFDMFTEEITPRALENKRKAVEFLIPLLRTGDLSPVRNDIKNASKTME